MKKEQSGAQNEKLPQVPREGNKQNKLTYQELVELMDHDSYQRIKGKIKQKRWAE